MAQTVPDKRSRGIIVYLDRIYSWFVSELWDTKLYVVMLKHIAYSTRKHSE